MMLDFGVVVVVVVVVVVMVFFVSVSGLSSEVCLEAELFLLVLLVSLGFLTSKKIAPIATRVAMTRIVFCIITISSF